jgi:uncharacterized protein with NRDE domain
MKVNVYIDGFNLYYGAVKGTPYRWLNVAEISPPCKNHYWTVLLVFNHRESDWVLVSKTRRSLEPGQHYPVVAGYIDLR